MLNLDSIIKYKNAISIDSTLSEAYYRLGKRTAITSTAQGHEYYSKAIQYNENFVWGQIPKDSIGVFTPGHQGIFWNESKASLAFMHELKPLSLHNLYHPVKCKSDINCGNLAIEYAKYK